MERERNYPERMGGFARLFDDDSDMGSVVFSFEFLKFFHLFVFKKFVDTA